MVHSIDDCTIIEAINTQFQCTAQMENMTGIVSRLSLIRSIFQNCKSIDITSSGNSELEDIAIYGGNVNSIFVLKAVSIIIKQQFTSNVPKQLVLLQAKHITIDSAIITCSLFGIFGQADIYITSSQIINESPSCNAEPIIDFITITPQFEQLRYTPQLSINVTSIMQKLSVSNTQQMFIKLMQSYQNYTLLIITEDMNITLDGESKIYSNRVGLYGRAVYNYGYIYANQDCMTNEGRGRGADIKDGNCGGGGGSSAGSGGIGNSEDSTDECIRFTSAGIFLNKLYPYNHQYAYTSGSGGASTDSTLSGGGIIILGATDSIHQNGLLSANGMDGYYMSKQMQSGGGGGGVISLKSQDLYGNGVITANGGDSDQNSLVGEGGGGLVMLFVYRTSYADYTIKVLKGTRIVKDQFKGTDGTVVFDACPEGHQQVGYRCQPCPSSAYTFGKSNECLLCPGIPITSQPLPRCDYAISNGFAANPGKFMAHTLASWQGLIGYIVMFLVVVIGYVLRRLYRMREQKYEKLPFDFENATKHMTLDHLFTENQKNNDNFQLVDLMYHAHRIAFKGNNSYTFPWVLPTHPQEDIEYLIVLDDFKRFATKVNRMAEWSKKETALLITLAILYYPLYWLYLIRRKKHKYYKIEHFVNSNELRFLKQMDEQSIRMKVSKSADYTLLYIDIFNYKESDLKYFFLSCPYIILLSGEGSFIRPFYLCQNNPFLTCLYFAINRIVEYEDDERNKIMENLVAHKKRMENSQQLNRFITKFNRNARAIDLSSKSIVKDVRALVKLCRSWNSSFFERFLIKINIVAMMDGETTILENYESREFEQYIEEVQHQDVRFGLFLFDTEVEVEEVDDVLENQKISFQEILPKEHINEEEEFSIDELKEQFIQRKKQSMHIETDSECYSESIMESLMVEESIPNKQISRKQHLLRILQRIRPMLMIHRIPEMDKHTIILIQLILALLDAMFLPILIAHSIDELMEDYNSFEQIQLYTLPYPLSIPMSQIFGCLWMSTQSYGLAKMYLIFTVLAIPNLLLYILVSAIDYMSFASTVILLMVVMLKVALIFTGKRILSLNINLKQINQSKHVI